jgi:predicted small lipoprotein YifL
MTRLLCCLAALLLAACGASGALYLPDQEPPKSSALGSKDPRKAQQSQVPMLPSATPAASAPGTPPTAPAAPATPGTTPSP